MIDLVSTKSASTGVSAIDARVVVADFRLKSAAALFDILVERDVLCTNFLRCGTERMYVLSYLLTSPRKLATAKIIVSKSHRNKHFLEGLRRLLNDSKQHQASVALNWLDDECDISSMNEFEIDSESRIAQMKELIFIMEGMISECLQKGYVPSDLIGACDDFLNSKLPPEALRNRVSHQTQDNFLLTVADFLSLRGFSDAASIVSTQKGRLAFL